LQLQLCALRQGDSVQHVLATTDLGELYGQNFFPACQHVLPFQQPPVGSWRLSLQLREWDGEQALLCDSMTFDLPYVVEPQLEVVEAAASTVVEVDFQRQQEAAADKEKTTAAAKDAAVAEKKPEVAKKPAVAKVAQPAVEAKPAKPLSKAKAAAQPVKADAKPTAKPAAPAVAKADDVVNVNNADVEAIAALEGVSKKLAQAVVDGRPYRLPKDLLKVKGFGKKTLDKIQSKIKL